MMYFKNLPIHKKLILIIMLVTLSTLLLTSTLLLLYDIHQLRQVTSNELRNSARLLASRSSAALIFDDVILAKENLQALQDLPQITMGCIYRLKGELFANYNHNNDQSSDCPALPDTSNNKIRFSNDDLHLIIPISSKQKILGYIYLRSNMVRINQRITQQIYMIILLIFFVSLIAFWLSKKLQKIISKPITDVANVATCIQQQGDYSQRAPIGSNDELGQLSQAFNAMLNTIEKQNQQLNEVKNILEVQVQQRTQELEIANKELESFSYSVSHDLRAPLRSISGFSQMLLEDHNTVLDAEGQNLLSRVISNTKRMSELIDDLLELSRLGRKELKTELVDFNNLVVEVVKSLQENDIRGVTRFTCGELGTVIADKRLLKIVTENLLGNAWKYSSKVDIPIIEMGKQKILNDDVFYINDNGAGFDMAYVNKIFGAFQRLHRIDEFEGTGIGLATVQRIIHRHNGRIWAEAELNKGAKFYFTLKVIEKQGI